MNEHDLDPPPPDVAEQAGPLPVRMLNEFTYCKRLFHLMHVDGRFVDNQYTVEGRHVHRRVEQGRSRARCGPAGLRRGR